MTFALSIDRNAEILVDARIRINVTPPADVVQAISEWTVSPITVKGKIMSSTLQSGKTGTAKIKWVDANGNPATVDGETEWATSDEAIATLDVDPGDSTICKVTSPGPIGDVSVQATADADIGDGTKTLTAVLSLTVIAGEAFGGEIEFTQNP